MRAKKSVTALMSAGLTAAIVSPAFAAPNSESYFLKRSSRQVLDLGTTGASVGDMAFSVGVMGSKRGRTDAGTYNFRGITVAVAIPGGRENRDSLIQLNLKAGLILMEKIISVPAGTVPDLTETYPITGGTGNYAGARGTVVFSVLSDSEYKVELRITK
jgi:hypothetical protein